MGNERIRYLSSTLSNLGVVGVGLGLWQGGSVWALILGFAAICYGYILSGRIES